MGGIGILWTHSRPCTIIKIKRNSSPTEESTTTKQGREFQSKSRRHHLIQRCRFACMVDVPHAYLGPPWRQPECVATSFLTLLFRFSSNTKNRPNTQNKKLQDFLGIWRKQTKKSKPEVEWILFGRKIRLKGFWGDEGKNLVWFWA